MGTALKVVGFILLFLAICLVLEILIPVKYPVSKLVERPGTQYWQLPTGSRIGYTLIPAKGIKKPFPVIFLQGGPGGPIYDRNIKMLAPLADHGFDVYLYDQVGCGLSSRLINIEDYTVERHKNDLAAIIKQTGAEKVILIGQSWGALLAAAFVADHPDKIASIVFTSPGPILPIHRELKNLPAPDSLHLRKPVFSNADGEARTYNLKATIMKNAALYFSKKLVSDEEADAFASVLNFEMAKSTVCDTNAITWKAAPGAGFYSQIMTVRSFAAVQDRRAELKKADMPILVLKGQCDNQPWGFTQEYLSLFPNHRFVLIPEAGHSIATEQPALYLNAITSFLAE